MAQVACVWECLLLFVGGKHCYPIVELRALEKSAANDLLDQSSCILSAVASCLMRVLYKNQHRAQQDCIT